MDAELRNFNDFIRILLESGFSQGGGSGEGIYSVVNFNWLNAPAGSPIVWHTGDMETDPWQWRVRVLNERDDIAYAKCFFKKSGYITREFYPFFLALRRGGRELADDYADGLISHGAKRIYEVINEFGELPLHEIKKEGGFSRGEKGKFDAALIELQMRLYVTINSTRRRVNAGGLEYGWDTTAFCATERFWENADVFARADGLSEADAYDAIRGRIMRLNPDADEKKIRKFAYGK